MMESPQSDRVILESSEEAADIGSSYYNPVCLLEDRGRKLCGTSLDEIGVDERMHLEPYLDDTHFIAGLMNALEQRIEDHEVLFGVFERPDYKVAPFIHSPESLIRFERQVIEGTLKRRGYYAVTEKEANAGLIRDFAV